MDIAGLSGGLTGAGYIENYRDRNAAGNAAGITADFAETLRRTAAERNTLPVTNAENSGNPSRTVKIDKTDKLYEQCVELEIFMVKTLISSMRSTVQKSGLIDEGFAGKMYEDMLYDEYARDFAKNANFGMAEMAYLELTGQRGKTIIRT
jgi:flagellar protein FlgJ